MMLKKIRHRLQHHHVFLRHYRKEGRAEEHRRRWRLKTISSGLNLDSSELGNPPAKFKGL